MKDVISIRDFSRADLDLLVQNALELKQGNADKSEKKRKVASLFFEPSTRTRTSSEVAAELDDHYVNGFAGTEGTSVKKGEPLADTVRMYEGYDFNAIVMRHTLEGAARLASDYVKIPVINGGDGPNGHPTQAMLDLMTIKEAKGKIDDLKVAFVGDLKYGRTVHSLLQAFEHYDVTPWLIAPNNVSLPEWRVKEYEANTGKKVVISDNLLDAIRNVDVLYMTRIQRERFPQGKEGDDEYEKVSWIYKLNAEILKSAHPNLKVMHPLPRYKNNLEVALDVDATSHALYFEQARNGMFMRQAILRKVFGDGFEGKKKEAVDEKYAEELPIGTPRSKKENLYVFNNGTLIDHLELGGGYKIKPLLRLMDYHDSPIIIGNNVPSAKYGQKDVYCLVDFFLTPEQTWKLGLISDRATINILKEGKVQRKFKVVLPSQLEGLIECQNRNCISRPEHFEHAKSRFYVESRQPLKLRCHYCEKPVGREEMKVIY